MTSFVEYDLIKYVMDSQDILKCVFVNDFWRVKKGVEDFTLRGKVSYKFSNDLPCERVKINVGMPSERLSLSEEFVEVRLGMRCSLMMLMVVWVRFCG